MPLCELGIERITKGRSLHGLGLRFFQTIKSEPDIRNFKYEESRKGESHPDSSLTRISGTYTQPLFTSGVVTPGIDKCNVQSSYGQPRVMSEASVKK